ncbi:hypothetical protein HK100_012129 [Physocladia obscura]|uniref:Uncharacterized protein n=1 Tax=Physocladia obscura TaxID=109957 RepID=A0AAD5XCQ7_9FUNG|nr:hypothetical protein HK100_012129 [Physocladia obscura]
MDPHVHVIDDSSSAPTNTDPDPNPDSELAHILDDPDVMPLLSIKRKPFFEYYGKFMAGDKDETTANATRWRLNKLGLLANLNPVQRIMQNGANQQQAVPASTAMKTLETKTVTKQVTLTSTASQPSTLAPSLSLPLPLSFPLSLSPVFPPQTLAAQTTNYQYQSQQQQHPKLKSVSIASNPPVRSSSLPSQLSSANFISPDYNRRLESVNSPQTQTQTQLQQIQTTTPQPSFGILRIVVGNNFDFSESPTAEDFTSPLSGSTTRLNSIPNSPINNTIDESPFSQGIALLNQSNLEYHPQSAFFKFQEACDVEQTLPRPNLFATADYNWYRHVLCLNNMAVSKRLANQFDDAFQYITEAWNITVKALVEEKERLMEMGIDGLYHEGWMYLVISMLELEVSPSWKRAQPVIDVKGKGVMVFESPIEDSNEMDQFFEHQFDSDDPYAPSSSSSRFPVSGGNSLGEIRLGEKASRVNTQKSHASTESQPEPEPDCEQVRVIHGPPIAVLFLDLTSNYGNILYNLGKIDAAFELHSQSCRLAEHILETCPLPQEFRMVFPLSTARRFATPMNGHVPPSTTTATAPNQTTKQQLHAKKPVPHKVAVNNTNLTSTATFNARDEATFFKDTNLPTPPRNQRIHLSYLHRSTILALARSLTHIATCLQALGLDDPGAVQCNSHALEIAQFYRDFGVVGVTAACQRRDGNEGVETLEQRQKLREDRWRAQKAMQKDVQRFHGEMMDPFLGVVMMNLAGSFYRKGRLSASFDILIKSSRLLKAIHHFQTETHAIASMYALKVEVGRRLKSIDWLRRVQELENESSDVEEFTQYFLRYWGPPRLHDINADGYHVDATAEQFLGATWVKDGLVGLKKCVEMFKRNDDVMGMIEAMLNMASAHITNGQPYIAMVLLAHLLTEKTRSNHSVCNTLSPIDQQMPEHLKLHTLYTVCQAVFLLHCVEKSNQRIYPKHVDYPSGFAWFDESVGISILLLSIGVQMENPLDLHLLGASFVTKVNTLERLKADIVENSSYPILVPSFIGLRAGSLLSSSRLHRHRIFEKNVSYFSNTDSSLEEDFKYGIGIGLDFLTQQSLLMKILLAKHDWVNTANIAAVVPLDKLSVLKLATQKLDEAAKNTMNMFHLFPSGGLISIATSVVYECSNILPKSNTSAPTTSTLTNVSGVGNNGGINHMRGVNTSASFGLSSSLTTTPLIENITKFTSGISTTAFTVPSLFSLAADIMANATLTRGAGSLLHVPMDIEPVKIHENLLQLSLDVARCGLGMCSACLHTATLNTEEYGDFWFVGMEGVAVRAINSGAIDENYGVGDAGVVFPEFGGRDPGVNVPIFFGADGVRVLRDSVVAKGPSNVHMFPCRHFFN